MAEPEKGTLDPNVKKKNGGGYWFARGGHALKTKFKPTITELADDYFDAGSSSNPSKFTKSLKNIGELYSE